ncbi:serine/threonine-protein kinase [Micromonospora coerulea]|uniref:serine/threonine-protein kinase n=1 Tax=Micromonospora coerulea TaxID=47856 RepID=UPI001903FF73|nr:serine/threonine-protein kinase [Micromonospora veneta]
MQQVVIARRYRLLELVGRGGMGRVWLARDEVLHREVAVKQVVPPAWLADGERDELRSRTLREARTAARLSHPHVVRVYDVVLVDGDPWLVMEYVSSRSLQDIVDDTGPLDPRRAAGIGLALLSALRAAHAAGVLHRDVKPANVLLATDGRVLLTDFGLAVFDGGDGLMTRPGLVLGSPQYVAPERAAEGVSSVEADLWSLGATLHTAVEGRSPYARSTAMATLTALASQPPDPAPHAGPLEPVLNGLLCRDPGQRIRHDEAGRLLAVAAAADVPPGTPARPPGPGTPSWDSTGTPPVTPVESPNPGGASAAATATAWARAARPGTPSPATGRGPAGARDDDPTTLLSPAAGVPSATGPGGTAAGPPARGRGRAAARRWGLAAAALVLAVAAGVGTALAVTRDPGGASTATGPGEPHGQPPAGYPPGPGPGRPGPPDGRRVPPPPFPCIRPDVVGEPVAAGSPPADEESALPAAWIWHADASGFRIAVPATWRYTREGNAACFQDPATRRILTVEPYRAGDGDPVDQLRNAEQQLIRAGQLPGYDEVRLDAAAGSVEWEFRWTAPNGETPHALRILPTDAEGWALVWTTLDGDWDAGRADLTRLRQSFRTGRTTPSAG